MRLRVKALLTNGASIFGFLTVLSSALIGKIQFDYLKLEESDIQQQVQRVRNTLESDLEHLSTRTLDWGAWDDLYNYMETLDPSWYGTNLNPIQTNNIGTDILGVIDLSGNPIVLSRIKTSPHISIDQSLFYLLNPTILKFKDSESLKQGYWLGPNEWILLSVRPILRGNEEGPPRGVLLMGIIMSEEYIQNISTKVDLTVNLLPAITDSDTIKVQPQGEQVTGETILKDLQQAPIARLQVSSPRRIVLQGKTALIQMLLSLWFVGFGFTLLSSLTLDTLFLSRLARLTVQIKKIALGSEPILDSAGNDEVSDLATAINDLIRKLNDSKQQAQAANQAKSLFLATMSHELRTPLNVVLGFVDLLQRELKLSEIHAQWLQTMQKSGHHLLNLINDILELSKIETGKEDLQLSVFDLHDLVATLHNLFLEQVKQKNLMFEYELDPETPKWVQSDERKLRQILLNLLSNAVKFTQQGWIRLTVSVLDSGSVSFVVSDTGEGISAEEQTKLFQVFSQTQTGLKSQQGTGLGLALCQRFTQIMGGTIQVKSQCHQGSEFCVILPLQAALPPLSTPSTQPTLSLNLDTPIHCLVVEDHPGNLLLLTEVLRSTGFEVTCATDGLEALQKTQESLPDVICMDMNLPKMHGLEAARVIRNLNIKQPIIIALSASVFDSDKVKVYEAGCDDFVAKPFQNHKILERIAFHLGIPYSESIPADFVPSTDPIPSTLTPQVLLTMPSSWKETFYQAALKSNEQEMRQLIKAIPNPSVQQMLHQRLDSFQTDKLFELAEQICETQQSQYSTR